MLEKYDHIEKCGPNNFPTVDFLLTMLVVRVTIYARLESKAKC